jgi:hypothetical protein
VNGRLSWLPHISNEFSQHDVEDKVERAAMARMLNLGLVLELIVDGFDDIAFAEQELVEQRDQAIFHNGFESGNPLNPLLLQLLEQGVG